MAKSRKKILLFLPAIFITTIFFGQGSNGFLINGRVSGMAEDDWVYLADATRPFDPVYLDSAQIVGNRFSFRGHLGPALPIRAMISTRNFEDYKYFWLENSVISFEVQEPGLTNAVVSGSRTQELEDSLFNLVAAIGRGHQKMKSFVRDHPESVISSRLLSLYAETWGKDTSAVLFDGLSTEIKHSFYGRAALAFIQGK